MNTCRPLPGPLVVRITRPSFLTRVPPLAQGLRPDRTGIALRPGTGSGCYKAFDLRSSLLLFRFLDPGFREGPCLAVEPPWSRAVLTPLSVITAARRRVCTHGGQNPSVWICLVAFSSVRPYGQDYYRGVSGSDQEACRFVPLLILGGTPSGCSWQTPFLLWKV